jgi:hypothetical protein
MTMNNTSQVTQKPALLSVVKRGRIEAPIRGLLYAADGVGKTTFAANAPEPIFLCAESGTAQLDVARLPEPEAWPEVLTLVEQLITEEHDFKTFVVDSLSWLEPMLHQYICQRGKKKSMAEFDFGKGHVAAFEEWRVFVSKVERLWKTRGMNVILLAHVHTANIKNPAGTDYGIICPKLHQAAEGLFREWVDAVLYAEFQTFEIGGDAKRAKVISDGARIMHTQHRGAFRAKNRYNLPETLPLDWQAFAEAVKRQAPADPTKLTARIESLLANADEALTARVRAAVAKAQGDAAQLARIHDHLSATVNIQAKENAHE